MLFADCLFFERVRFLSGFDKRSFKVKVLVCLRKINLGVSCARLY